MSFQDDQLPSKRFSHKSRAGNKSKGQHGRKGNASQFHPRNMLGRYQVQSSFFAKLAPGEDVKEMWLEIHHLVASGTAYFASFDLGAVVGVMIIAGSRKSLRNAVIEVESDEDGEDEEELGDDAQNKDVVDGDDQNEDEDLDESGSGDDHRLEDEGAAFISPPELERPDHAFEKNTFRTPKWFAQWRGRIRQRPEISEQRDGRAGAPLRAPEQDTAANQGREIESATHNAHLEFSTAACNDFEATFSCQELDAKDASWKGWKITNKPRPATSNWSEFA